jgi:transcriptional regulator with XRE-family HTH domain
MDQTFGEWLLEVIQGRGWSQADLARASGLTRAAISNYVNNKITYPDEHALARIARALQLPPEELYRRANIPTTPLPTPETQYKNILTYRLDQLTETQLSEVLRFIDYIFHRDASPNAPLRIAEPKPNFRKTKHDPPT